MKLAYKGKSVFYTDDGEGPTIVLLHGFLENSSMWEPLILELKSRYRCIAIDLLGHGKTDVYDYVHTMEAMAEAVNAVLIDNDINKATFIGHSMGGYVLLSLAKSSPEKFKGLCLMNSTALSDNEERKNIRDRAIEVIKNDKRIFISMAISNLFAPKNLLVYSDEINQLKNQAYQLTIKGINAALSGMKLRPSRVKIFSRLNCKKLVILGNQDSILIIDEQKKYLDSINTQIEVLEGGHMPHIENYNELSYKIKQFIEK